MTELYTIFNNTQGHHSMEKEPSAPDQDKNT